MGEERCVPARCFPKAAEECTEHPLAEPRWPGGAPRLPGLTPRPCRQPRRCTSSLGSQPGTMAALCSGRSRSTPGTRVTSGLRGPPLSLPGSRAASAAHPEPGGCRKSWWPRSDRVHCKLFALVPGPCVLRARSGAVGILPCPRQCWLPKPVLEHCRDPVPCCAAVKQTQRAVKARGVPSPPGQE